MKREARTSIARWPTGDPNTWSTMPAPPTKLRCTNLGPAIKIVTASYAVLPGREREYNATLRLIRKKGGHGGGCYRPFFSLQNLRDSKDSKARRQARSLLCTQIPYQRRRILARRLTMLKRISTATTSEAKHLHCAAQSDRLDSYCSPKKELFRQSFFDRGNCVNTALPSLLPLPLRRPMPFVFG